MFQEIPANDERIIAFKAIGKLTHDDYQEFLPRLEPLIEKAGTVSVFLELENFHGWDLAAAKDDYAFGKKYANNFRRIAIIGEKRWGRWLARFARPFTGAEVRYFERDDLQQAWDWLREPFVKEVAATAAKLPEWRHVLMPTDFSAHAEHALQRAVEITRRYGARLTLMNVVEEALAYDELYDPLEGGFAYPIVDTELSQMQMDNTRKRLEEKAAGLGLSNVTVEVTVGTPKSAIRSYAEAQQVDLVVMGSHGRRGLARLLGSTTHAVLHGVRCDVLSVPIPVAADKHTD